MQGAGRDSLAVLHVPHVLLQDGGVVHQVGVRLGEGLRHVSHGQGRADACSAHKRARCQACEQQAEACGCLYSTQVYDAVYLAMHTQVTQLGTGR